MYEINIENTILADESLKSSEKILLIVLVRHLNPRDSRCFPGIQTLIKETGLSRATIFTCRDSLHKHGLLSWSKKNAADHCNYTLALSRFNQSSKNKLPGVQTEDPPIQNLDRPVQCLDPKDKENKEIKKQINSHSQTTNDSPVSLASVLAKARAIGIPEEYATLWHRERAYSEWTYTSHGNSIRINKENWPSVLLSFWKNEKREKSITPVRKAKKPSNTIIQPNYINKLAF